MMLAAALEAKAYRSELMVELDEHGQRFVTRNGRARRRKVPPVAGALEITG
jgi:hypothetical protein